MSNFSSFIMTDSGRSIVAKANAQQENAIVYTRFICSENRYTVDDIPQLETIDNINQEVAVSSVTYQAPDVASISAKLTSSDVENGYYLQTIAVYAKNKIDNEEKLYAVSIETEPEKADWISPSSSINIIDTLITANFIIAKAQISKIEIVPAGTVSIDQFNEHVNSEGINRVHGCTPEPNVNSIVSRDAEGSSKVNMPSSIENTTIVNNKYLEEQLQSGLSTKQDKLTSGTNIEITEDNVINVKGDVTTAASQVTQTNETLGNNVQTALDILNSRYMIPCYYEQLTDDDGSFLEDEEPANWYQALYGITTVWELVHNTKSIVYRTEGDKASVGRVNGLQPYGIKNISGVLMVQDHPVISSANGTFFADYLYPKTGVSRATTTKDYYQGFNFRTDRQIKSYSDDLVMDNLLVRKWKLVSINGVLISDLLKQYLLNKGA